MVLLVDNIYHILKGPQDFVLLKVTEKEIQATSQEFKYFVKPKNQPHHCKQRGRGKYRLKRQQTTAILSGR